MTRKERIAQALIGQRIDTLTLSPGAILMLTITEEQAHRLAETIDDELGDHEPAAVEQDGAAGPEPSPAVIAPLINRELDYRPPRTAGIEYSAGAQRFMEDTGISPITIQEVLNRPDAKWQGENPHAKDQPTVAVRNGYHYGAVYYQDDDHSIYVVSVEPASRLYDKRRSLTSGFRSAGGGGPKRAPVTSRKDLTAAVEAAGLEFSAGKTHGQVKDPARPELGYQVVPMTPSDGRAWANCTSGIRRRFGVEI